MNKKSMLIKWVKTWEKASIELERIKYNEIHNVNERKVIVSLDSAFKSAISTIPPKPYSGLIELQKIFSRMRS